MARPNPRYEELLQEQEDLSNIHTIAEEELKEIEKTPANIVSDIATTQRQIISQAKTELIQVRKEIVISSEVNKIIQDLDDKKLIAPNYFNNNIIWVLSGHITNDAFLTSYHSFVNQGLIHAPIIEPEPEVEPMVLLSANVKISFINSNIGGFSSSIPIEDIGQLQILSNESSEWRYTLIGTSTNQPLQTLSELINMINENLLLLRAAEEQAAAAQAAAAQAAAAQAAAAQAAEEQAAAAQAVAAQAAAAQAAEEQAVAQVEEEVVADVIDPSTEGAFEDPVYVENGERDVTPTPTEERPVKWIPEPFFSFINEVFSK